MPDDRRLFLDLLQRFNRLGAQFPHEADIRNAATRASAISSAKLVLAEMNAVKAEIDLALGIETTE